MLYYHPASIHDSIRQKLQHAATQKPHHNQKRGGILPQPTRICAKICAKRAHNTYNSAWANVRSRTQPSPAALAQRLRLSH